MSIEVTIHMQMPESYDVIDLKNMRNKNKLSKYQRIEQCSKVSKTQWLYSLGK